MADTNARTIVGGFVTRSKRCPGGDVGDVNNAPHICYVTRVLGYGEEYRGVCERCRMPVTVQGASWVSDMFTIVEEPDLLDELLC